jgi:adenosylcobinamide kinase/adenosylcobinamide-phosphate guanylyltransferase
MARLPATAPAVVSSPTSLAGREISLVTLVLGGARSGKSRYAQQIAEGATGVLFVATAEARDDAEMFAKIARHRTERPAHWQTLEEPMDLARAITSATSQLVLIDCLTLFAANLLERFGEDTTADHPTVTALCATLAITQARVVLVSNETGQGVVPAYALGRRFRDLNGEINQRVAAVATNVLYIVAGLPILLKGEFPK